VELSEYPRMIRRRWVPIAVVTGIMLVFAWLTVPSESQAARQHREEISYRAVHTLIADQSAKNLLDSWSLKATSGPIPESVAEELDLGRVVTAGAEPGRPGGGRSRNVTLGKTQVRVTTDTSAWSVAIAATDAQRDRAEEVAQALASKLQALLGRQAVQQYDEQLERAVAKVGALRAEAAELAPGVAAGDPSDEAAYQSTLSALGVANSDLTTLRNSGPPDAPLRTLDAGDTAERIVTVSGLQPPKGRTTRLLLGGGLGLVLGLGVAMVLERLDASIRGVVAAEAAAQLPVIAEIPHVRIRKGSRYEILSLTMPKSLFAEAYRGLRTSISLMSMAHATGAHAAGGSDDELVVARGSPRPPRTSPPRTRAWDRRSSSSTSTSVARSCTGSSR
jgi:hypothetical protein